MSYLTFVTRSGAGIQFVNNLGVNLYFTVSDPVAPPNYDILSAIDLLFPGVVVQRNLIDAAMITVQINGGKALSESDVSAVLALANTLDQADAGYVPTLPAVYPTTLPTYPTGMPRFPDSNPSPDGWSIANNGNVVWGPGSQ